MVYGDQRGDWRINLVIFLVIILIIAGLVFYFFSSRLANKIFSLPKNIFSNAQNIQPGANGQNTGKSNQSATAIREEVTFSTVDCTPNKYILKSTKNSYGSFNVITVYVNGKKLDKCEFRIAIDNKPAMEITTQECRLPLNYGQIKISIFEGRAIYSFNSQYCRQLADMQYDTF